MTPLRRNLLVSAFILVGFAGVALGLLVGWQAGMHVRAEGEALDAPWVPAQVGQPAPPLVRAFLVVPSAPMEIDVVDRPQAL